MKPKIPAAVSAQRMGKIVVNEAQQEADRLATQARAMSRHWRRRFWSLYKKYKHRQAPPIRKGTGGAVFFWYFSGAPARHSGNPR